MLVLFRHPFSNPSMKPAPLLLVPFKEIRHDQHDDCLHHELVQVRGREMDWSIPAHRHEGLHQFQFLHRGAVRGTVDGHAFNMAAPALLMLAPGSVHGFEYTSDTEGHQVTVPTATLRELLGDAQFLGTELQASFVLPSLDVAQAQACEDLFQRIAHEFQQQRPGRVHALLACATLLAVLFVRGHGEAFARVRPQGTRDTLVQRYLALVEQHYRHHEPLSFYADSLVVTADHLSRCCRAVQGQSALDLLNGRRMLEARRMLAYTGLSVAEVAQQLGYDDPAYFSKFFQRSTGNAPSAYRALVAQGVRVC
jgi:AraC family transcriptional regulator, transcriptional activator of pobA